MISGPHTYLCPPGGQPPCGHRHLRHAPIVLAVLLTACGSTSTAGVETQADAAAGTSQTTTAVTDARGLWREDGSPSGQLPAYEREYSRLQARCADGQGIAFALSANLSVYRENTGRKLTALQMIDGLLTQLHGRSDVGCVAAITDYTSDLTQGQSPSVNAKVIPAGPSLPPAGCSGLSWPQPVPSHLVGADITDAVNALMCFNMGPATAPDGHDVLDTAADNFTPWKVVTVSPRSGTLVNANTVIRMTVTKP